MCDGHGGSRCVENVIRVFPKQLAEQLRPVFNEDLSPAVLCDQLIHAFDEVCNRARCCHCGIDDGVGHCVTVRS
jgi:hypothetical protein